MHEIKIDKKGYTESVCSQLPISQESHTKYNSHDREKDQESTRKHLQLQRIIRHLVKAVAASWSHSTGDAMISYYYFGKEL